MSLFTRTATVEDAETVLGIVRAAFAEYEGTIPVPPGALSDTLEDTRQAVEEGRTLLAYVDFRAVGTVRYKVRPDYLYVGRLAVVPEYRGRGVGEALMRYIEDIAPQLGRTRIRLGTRASMPGNLAFYEKLGYTVAETHPHERGADVVVWFEKVLSKGGETGEGRPGA